MRRVLIIAAHPDDDILGCGGYISKNNNKGEVFKVIFLAEGSTCRFSSKDEVAALNEVIYRNNLAKKSLESLNISDYEFFNLPCGRLDQIDIIEINKIIENVVKEYKPSIIFTHSDSDVNNDHRIIFNSTLMATRPTQGSSVETIYSYEVLSSTEWSFVRSFSPNVFIELTEDDIENKWLALSHYVTEIKSYPFPRSKIGVEVLAKYRGMQSGFCYAEAFQLIREFRA